MTDTAVEVRWYPSGRPVPLSVLASNLVTLIVALEVGADTACLVIQDPVEANREMLRALDVLRRVIVVRS